MKILREIGLWSSCFLFTAALVSLFAYAAFDYSWWAFIPRGGDDVRGFFRGVLLLIFHTAAIVQFFVMLIVNLS